MTFSTREWHSFVCGFSEGATVVPLQQPTIKFTARLMNADSENEVGAFRALTTESLVESGKFLLGSSEDIRDKDFAYWQNRCRGIDGKNQFGLFANDNLVGKISIKRIYKNRLGQDFTKRVAFVSEAYIQAEYRKRSTIKLWFVVKKWLAENNVQIAVATIHPENLAAISACKRLGARRTHEAGIPFSDGHIAKLHRYRLVLDRRDILLKAQS